MKKILISLGVGAAVLLGACVAYFFIYFQKIDGISIGSKIAQGQPDKPALLVIDIQEGITGKSAPTFTQNMVRKRMMLIDSIVIFHRLSSGL